MGVLVRQPEPIELTQIVCFRGCYVLLNTRNNRERVRQAPQWLKPGAASATGTSHDLGAPRFSPYQSRASSTAICLRPILEALWQDR
jgi:hypothetical protein